MWILTVAAGLLGFSVFYFTGVKIPPEYGVYISIATLAGLDAIIGGFRAAQQHDFQSKIFVSGFLTGVILAVALTWFGERIGVEIGLAAVFVFISRILQNLSIIRRVALAEERFSKLHLPTRIHWPTHQGTRTRTLAETDEDAPATTTTTVTTRH